MVSLIAIYKAPQDQVAFDKHYNETHSPLAAKMEGLRKMEVFRMNKMLTPPTSMLAEGPYLMCVMYFDNQEALDKSMASDSGRAAARDLRGFAGPLVSMVTAEVEETQI